MLMKRKDLRVQKLIEVCKTEMMATKVHAAVPPAIPIQTATIVTEGVHTAVVQKDGVTESDQEAEAVKGDDPGVEAMRGIVVVAGNERSGAFAAVVRTGEAEAEIDAVVAEINAVVAKTGIAGVEINGVEVKTGVGPGAKIGDFDVVEAEIGNEPEVEAELPVTADLNLQLLLVTKSRQNWMSLRRYQKWSRNQLPSNLPLNDFSQLPKPGMMTPQMAVQQAMAAMNARAQQLTGVTLPKYYNPAAVNPLKYAEQMQKRKLLWQSNQKKVIPTPSMNNWEQTTFAQDQDGKMAAKFKKLMGIKNEAEEKATPPVGEDQLRKQEELFRTLDQQYETARMSTHSFRGVGLGFSSAATSGTIGSSQILFPK